MDAQKAGRDPSVPKRRRLGHPVKQSVQDLLLRADPGAERRSGIPILGGAVIAENQVIPAVPLKIVAAFRLVRISRNQKRFFLTPVFQIVADKMRKAAVPLPYLRILKIRRHKHVISAVRTGENLGISGGNRFIGRLQGEVLFRLGKMDAVVADRPAEPRAASVHHPHRVKRVIFSLCPDHRTGTDGAFPLVGDLHRDRVLLPVNHIPGRNMGELMGSLSPFCLVLMSVLQVK